LSGLQRDSAPDTSNIMPSARHANGLTATAALLEDRSVFVVVPGRQIDSVATRAGKKCVPRHLVTCDFQVDNAFPNFDKRVR